MVRLKENGELDGEFKTISLLSSAQRVQAIALDEARNRLYVGGNFLHFDKIFTQHFARLRLQEEEPLIRLRLLHLIGHPMAFSFPTFQGLTYRLEARGTLTTSGWNTVERFEGDGLDHLVTDSPGLSGHMFFRAVLE